MMKSKAFSLLELLLVITMLLILGMVLGPIFGNITLSSSRILSRREALAESRISMDRMVNEIRLIPGTNVLANIGVNNLQFQYPTGTSITYSLSGASLLRNSDILAGNVNALTFSYYDELGNTTAAATNVRSIGIQLVILSPGDNSTLTLRSRVFLRNTGHDYGNFTSP